MSGGTLPPDTASYVERGADKVLFESLMARRFCYVLNSRQLGKSSLSVHTITKLQSVGIRTVFLDMTRFGGKNLTAEQWYMGLAVELARELGCRRELVTYWKENAAITPVQRLFGAIRDVVLTGKDQRPLVIFIDEIDATRSLPFDPDEFYAAIRECFNRRVSDESFGNLTFCLLGVAVPSDLIRNPATTPFNIGERIPLGDFTLEEMSAFAQALGLNGLELVQRVHYWTGGHPFLSQSLCRSIAKLGLSVSSKDVDEIVRRELFDYKARVSNINLADVSNIALHYDVGDSDPVAFRADLLSDYERALAGKQVVDDESNRVVVVLKLSGIVRSDGRRLFVRNRIYMHVFDRVWIRENMPEQELRRQSQSFRRGVLRTALFAGAMVAVLGAVAGIAWFSQVKTMAAESKLAYELYVADMNSLRLFYDKGDTGRIEAILSRHEQSPYRGFEWGYWFGRYRDSKEEYTLAYDAPGKREEGHISSDGKEICIVDSLTGTATIVDRATKRRVLTVKLNRGQRVVALQEGWALLELINKVAEVVDLKSGKMISRLGESEHWVQDARTWDHSNLILTNDCLASEKDPNRTANWFLGIWDASTGKKLYGTRRGLAGLMALSSDGRILVSPVDAGTKDTGGSSQYCIEVVRDVAKNTIIDSFPISGPDYGMRSAPDHAGMLFNAGSKAYLRDFHGHRTEEWHPPIDGPWSASASMFEKDMSIVLLNGGRCLTTRLPSNGFVSMRENVFSIQQGSRDGEYLGSSNSVRVYDVDSPSNAAIVTHGLRVTRFGPHTLNVFQNGSSAMQQVNEDTFEQVGAIPNVGYTNAYTYSGRWYLDKTNSGTYDTLRGIDPPGVAIKLPFQPTQWSCGLHPDSIACWSPDHYTLCAYSGQERRVRWTRPNIKNVVSLWVSPNGQRIFLVLEDKDVEVFDMEDGRPLGSMNSHNNGPIYMTFSADGSKTFTCGGDGRAVMWDTMTLKKLVEFRGNEQEGMRSGDLSPDGRRVVTASQSGAWQLWDAANGRLLLDVQASPLPLSSAIFSSDGQRIVTAGEDGNVRVWTTVENDPTTYVPIDPTFLKGLYP